MELIVTLYLDICLYFRLASFSLSPSCHRRIQKNNNNTKGEATRCVGCRRRTGTSGGSDRGAAANVFVTAYTILAAIGIDGVVIDSIVAAAAAAAGATPAPSAVVVCSVRRYGCANERNITQRVGFYRRRRRWCSAAFSPIRTQGSQVSRNDAVSQEEGDAFGLARTHANAESTQPSAPFASRSFSHHLFVFVIFSFLFFFLFVFVRPSVMARGMSCARAVSLLHCTLVCRLPRFLPLFI